jgi:hypothetical protein
VSEMKYRVGAYVGDSDTRIVEAKNIQGAAIKYAAEIREKYPNLISIVAIVQDPHVREAVHRVRVTVTTRVEYDAEYAS